MKEIIERVKGFINSGDVRSVKAKKNIIYSFIIRGISMVTTLFLVPVTLGFVSSVEYGIWVTLSSFITWFSVFDVGLGNGLRNKFAEAIAKNDVNLARTYVSTTYAGLIIIFAAIFILFIGIYPHIDWVQVFKTGPDNSRDIRLLVIILFGFFTIRFILQLISTLLIADQRPALASLVDPITNLIVLAIIFVLSKITDGSLLYLGIIIGTIPLIVLIGFNIFFYRRDYKSYIPSRKFVSFKYFKELMGLGFRFFIIQIATMLIFTSDNMIITQILDPKHVTPYSLSRQYFGVIATAFMMIVRPFWSAFTEAYVKGDIQWIRKSLRALVIIWLFTVLGTLLMIFISDWFYDLWLPSDRDFKIPIHLSIFMGVFMLILTWNTMFGYFINGSGKIQVQYYLAIVVAVINIPLSIFLAKTMGLGSTGVILGTSLSLLPGAILFPIQVKKILNNTASGIWDK